MGDVLVVLVVILLFGAVIVGVILGAQYLATRGHSAPKLDATPGVAAAQARVYYRLAQRGVVLLDRLMSDPMTNCVIPSDVADQIRDLSHEFYEL